MSVKAFHQIWEIFGNYFSKNYSSALWDYNYTYTDLLVLPTSHQGAIFPPNIISLDFRFHDFYCSVSKSTNSF